MRTWNKLMKPCVFSFRDPIRNEDLALVLQELSDEEQNNEDQEGLVDHLDLSGESEGEEEQVLEDDDHSASEESGAEDDVEPMVRDDTDFQVHISQEKSNDTFCLSETCALPSKANARNIVKVLPGPKRYARDARSEIDFF